MPNIMNKYMSVEYEKCFKKSYFNSSNFKKNAHILLIKTEKALIISAFQYPGRDLNPHAVAGSRF